MFEQYIEAFGLTPSMTRFRGNLYKRVPKPNANTGKNHIEDIYVVFACAPYVMWRYEHWKAMKNGGLAGKDYSPFELERPIQSYVTALPVTQGFASNQPIMIEAELFFQDYEPA